MRSEVRTFVGPGRYDRLGYNQLTTNALLGQRQTQKLKPAVPAAVSLLRSPVESQMRLESRAITKRLMTLLYGRHTSRSY